jgi:hypothetical protein
MPFTIGTNTNPRRVLLGPNQIEFIGILIDGKPFFFTNTICSTLLIISGTRPPIMKISCSGAMEEKV